jgi:hypothetical protein
MMCSESVWYIIHNVFDLFVTVRLVFLDSFTLRRENFLKKTCF